MGHFQLECVNELASFSLVWLKCLAFLKSRPPPSPAWLGVRLGSGQVWLLKTFGWVGSPVSQADEGGCCSSKTTVLLCCRSAPHGSQPMYIRHMHKPKSHFLILCYFPFPISFISARFCLWKGIKFSQALACHFKHLDFSLKLGHWTRSVSFCPFQRKLKSAFSTGLSICMQMVRKGVGKKRPVVPEI